MTRENLIGGDGGTCVWWSAAPDSGALPENLAVACRSASALERLSRSESPAHAGYAQRQLELLDRL